jgi:pimeloyl-ACP methyl ester carboxylesterase
MNSFIFGFHPRGLSLEADLASRGLEVWSVDLRGQGHAVPIGKPRETERYGIVDLAVTDLSVAIRTVLAKTETGARKVDLLGASLGATISLTHLALTPDAPVHAVVSMGGLVTWVDPHPALRAAFFSPALVGLVPVKNTRRLVGVVFERLLRHAPGVLSVYLNPSSTDCSQPDEMLRTVEDPNRFLNREIAAWIGRRELVVRAEGGAFTREVNVSRAIANLTHPLLCIVGNHDGIVPPGAARSPYDAIGSKDKELLCVGEDDAPIAHADLFIATGAQERVFDRIATFLIAR